MKVHKEFNKGPYDLALFGLGYESRAVSSFLKYKEDCNLTLALGYNENTDKIHYKENKKRYLDLQSLVFEGSDDIIFRDVNDEIEKLDITSPISVLIDITVMSRHRLATLICMLIDKLPKNSTINIIYMLSEFVEPPQEYSPIRKVGEITPQLAGGIGDLGLPTSLVFGLGYEKSKALGVANLLDTNCIFAFIPQSPIEGFEELVQDNNKELLASIPKESIFRYDVCAPYSTYLSMKSIILSLSDFSRPLLIPLGPKIISAIGVIIGKELFPELPVWRVSSEHSETPVERPSSNIEVKLTISL